MTASNGFGTGSSSWLAVMLSFNGELSLIGEDGLFPLPKKSMSQEAQPFSLFVFSIGDLALFCIRFAEAITSSDDRGRGLKSTVVDLE